MADGGGVGLCGGALGCGGRGFHGHQGRAGQVGPQPDPALGQGLGVRIDRAHGGQGGRIAQQTVRNAGKKLGLDVDLVLEEQVKAHAHRALEGVFQRHHAQFALAGGHFFKNFGQVVAGVELGGVAQVLHARKVRERALRPQIGHVLRPLQGAGRGKNLPPDGPQVVFGQGAGVLGGQAVQHFLFPQGLEDDARHMGLDAAHLQAQGRPAVAEGQQLAVHAVNFFADGGQAGLGVCRGKVRGRGGLRGLCRGGGVGGSAAPMAGAFVHA